MIIHVPMRYLEKLKDVMKTHSGLSYGVDFEILISTPENLIDSVKSTLKENSIEYYYLDRFEEIWNG